MTAFTSVFWDYYVAILTVVSVIACAVFLKAQSKRRVVVAKGAEPTTSGHVWDEDLREYNNPLPRWWVWLFYLTVLFSIGYLVLFPGLGSRFGGTLSWTSQSQLKSEMQAAEAVFGPMMAAYLQQDLPQVSNDRRARLIGERIFLNSCAQCHGSDARGSRGFPNLTDSEWLWGGTPEAIEKTITEGRQGQMPPMAEAIGGPAAAEDVAHYVLSLSDSAHDSVKAIRGQPKFAVCAACHGADGKGNIALGAPDLTNKIWLYGGSTATIIETITKGRHGVMPAHQGLLSPAQIHLVAAYVYGMSTASRSATEPKP